MTEIPRAVVRHSARGLTQRKRSELLEIAGAWHRARREYVRDYWGVEYCARVMLSPRRLRDERRASGWAAVDLPVHYHHTALLSALALIRDAWATAVGRARQRVGKDPSLGSEARHWMRAVMRAPSLLQECLDGRVPEVRGSWPSDLNSADLSRRMRKVVLAELSRRPRARSGPWFEVDGTLYRAFLRAEDRYFKGAWIALATHRPKERVAIPLAGRTLRYIEPRNGARTGPNLRIDVGRRVTFHSVDRTPVRSTSGTTAAGIDKGYRTLLTVSRGAPEAAREYGRDAKVLIATLADASAQRAAQRRRLRSHMLSVRETDRSLARRIRRHNLGGTKLLARTQRDRVRLRQAIDRSLNVMFADSPDVSHLYAESLTFPSGRTSSRTMNRRLARWSKGYLHRRLTEKAGLNGVELTVVNAACTSQTCPRCWYTSTENRASEHFTCRSCGYSGSADAIAATNVLARGSDPAITRWTAVSAVKQILDRRWRSAQSGSARDSTAAGPAEAGPLDESRITARRGRPSLSSVGSPWLEHGTSAMSTPRSNQLSYEPSQTILTAQDAMPHAAARSGAGERR